jgi:hypothetical protein
MPPKSRRRKQTSGLFVRAATAVAHLPRGVALRNLTRLGVDLSEPRTVKRVIGSLSKLHRHHWVSEEDLGLRRWYKDPEEQTLTRAACPRGQKLWYRNPGSRDLESEELALCRKPPKGKRP